MDWKSSLTIGGAKPGRRLVWTSSWVWSCLGPTSVRLASSLRGALEIHWRADIRNLDLTNSKLVSKIGPAGLHREIVLLAWLWVLDEWCRNVVATSSFEESKDGRWASLCVFSNVDPMGFPIVGLLSDMWNRRPSQSSIHLSPRIGSWVFCQMPWFWFSEDF